MSSPLSIMIVYTCVHSRLERHAPSVSCADLCLIWSPPVSTWTPTGPWHPRYLLLLLRGLSLCCLPFLSILNGIFIPVVVCSHAKLMIKERVPHLSDRKVLRELGSLFGNAQSQLAQSWKWSYKVFLYLVICVPGQVGRRGDTCPRTITFYHIWGILTTIITM